MPNRKWDDRLVWLPFAYLLLVALAMAFPFLVNSAVATVYAVLLSAPWSMLAVALFDPAVFARGMGFVVLAGGGILNALLLYCMIWWIRQKRGRRGTPPR